MWAYFCKGSDIKKNQLKATIETRKVEIARWNLELMTAKSQGLTEAVKALESSIKSNYSEIEYYTNELEGLG